MAVRRKASGEATDGNSDDIDADVGEIQGVASTKMEIVLVVRHR